MPMIGVIDPSHTTKRRLSSGELPDWYTVEGLMEKAATASSKWSPWVYETIAAAMGEHQERGTRISTTAITAGCPRGLVLERMEPYIGKLDGMLPSLRGTMVHRTLEGYARPGSIAEARFYMTVDGVEISCSPDLLTEDTVYDYKVTESPPTFGYPYRHHTEQLMLNAFIARHMEDFEFPFDMPFDPREHPVENAVVVYIGPKFIKPILVERKTEFYTPSGALKEGKRPYIWDDTETLAFLRPRLDMLVRAFEAYPEWVPGAEDVWGGQPGYECPGPPLCNLPDCLAKRKMFTWGEPLA